MGPGLCCTTKYSTEGAFAFSLILGGRWVGSGGRGVLCAARSKSYAMVVRRGIVLGCPSKAWPRHADVTPTSRF